MHPADLTRVPLSPLPLQPASMCLLDWLVLFLRQDLDLPDWPGILDPLTSASRVLGLQMYTHPWGFVSSRLALCAHPEELENVLDAISKPGT